MLVETKKGYAIDQTSGVNRICIYIFESESFVAKSIE